MTDDYRPDAPRTPYLADDREVRAESRAALWKRLAVVVAAAAVLFVLGGMAYLVFAIRETQVNNKPVLRDTHAAADAAVRAAADAARTANRIEDCTTPGGKCFERSQRATGTAVSGINTVTIRATACAVSFLTTSTSPQTLPTDQLAAKIKACIQSGRVVDARVGAGSSLLSPPKAPSSQGPAAQTPKPRPHPVKHPHPKPPEQVHICVLNVCLPLDLSLLLRDL